MPALIAVIGAFLQSSVFRVVITRILVALGISMATYTGISAGASAIWSSVQSNLASLPQEVVSLLVLAKIPNCFNVVISAYGAALALRGLTSSGVLKRVAWGGNGASVMEQTL